MDITITGKTVHFRPWHPNDGRVFAKVFAVDTETTVIDEQRPWVTPSYVLGAACDRKKGFFIQRQYLREFIEIHDRLPMVFHNAPFDLAVIHLVVPELDIYRRVDADEVWDTQLLHRLNRLGGEGHTANGKGAATLETCAADYLGVELPKDVTDSRNKTVRTSYGQWLNRPPHEIEPVYLEYLAKDAVVTFLLFRKLQAQIKALLEDSDDAWGYVSRRWSVEQTRRFGWQTHHIQLKAAVVLREITANGLAIDLGNRDTLVEQLRAVQDQQLAALRKDGYIPKQKGSGKAIQEIFRRLEARHPDQYFPRTEKKGDYKTSEEALRDLIGVEPFVDTLLRYREVNKLLGTFLDKMGASTLHPSFNVLARSGRTSSFGQINAKNLPQDARVRSCFVPSPGHVFVDADYSTVEMATLAQSVIGQLGIRSSMAEYINGGADLHQIVAARFFGRSEQEVTKEERQKAKPINFGKPGGMGHTTLQKYALTSYGVKLSDEEVQALSDSWFDLFPEMDEFLDDNVDVPLRIAETLGLSPHGHFEHTGSRRFLDHPANAGREDNAHPILGAMLLKAIKEPEPCTESGRRYSAEELDYFWQRLVEHVDVLPTELRVAVIGRRPSKSLQRAVMKEFGRGPVFTFSGRLRADATYAARHNTMFQGLAADGAKLALWLLWRAGYRIVNFIHDEMLVEIPADSNMALHAEIIRRLMVTGMKAVVPDVRIEVEYGLSRHWTKGAQVTFDSRGRMVAMSAAQSVVGG